MRTLAADFSPRLSENYAANCASVRIRSSNQKRDGGGAREGAMMKPVR